MKNQSPSILQRNALRAFIRGHAGAEIYLKGHKVNDLTISELRTIAAALSGDATWVPPAQSESESAGDNEGDNLDVNQDNRDMNPSQGDKGTSEQLAAIRDLIVNGGFTAADTTLRKLISDANKPAEVIEIPTGGAPGTSSPVTHARPTNIDQPWGKLFSVKGDMGKRTSRLWDGAHSETPKKNDGYVWPQPATPIALSTLARGKNIWLYGPPGTGKTEWARQFAASTGRPCVVISCDDQTDGPTLLGMTVPSQDGGTKWQDGILTMAIQIPGCVICIDEPSIARPGALMVMQHVLEYGALYINESGRKIKVAKNVVFIACDNTNGTGGGARHGFTGTGRLNDAFLRRFSVFLRLSYLPKDKEARVIMRDTGCTKELADLLISVATTTRAEANKGVLTNGIGLRMLFSWAALLTDGVEPRDAFDAAVLDCAPEQDREALTQQCLLSYDTASIARALDPQKAAKQPENANQTDAGRAAAQDFAQ